MLTKKKLRYSDTVGTFSEMGGICLCFLFVAKFILHHYGIIDVRIDTLTFRNKQYNFMWFVDYSASLTSVKDIGN